MLQTKAAVQALFDLSLCQNPGSQNQPGSAKANYTKGKCYCNPLITFWIVLFTNRQTDKQTNATKNRNQVIIFSRARTHNLKFTSAHLMLVFPTRWRLRWESTHIGGAALQ